MNTTFNELLERFVPFVLDRCSLNNSYNIIDYDFDRVYLEIEGEPNTYVIRMWSITKTYIRFSMFENIPETHSGKALVDSQYFFYKVMFIKP